MFLLPAACSTAGLGITIKMRSYCNIMFRQTFTRAGEASSDVAKAKAAWHQSEAVRKVAIAMYEGEIIMVIHANGGEITVEITPEKVRMVLMMWARIPDIELAAQAGYSIALDEVRNSIRGRNGPAKYEEIYR